MCVSSREFPRDLYLSTSVLAQGVAVAMPRSLAFSFLSMLVIVLWIFGESLVRLPVNVIYGSSILLHLAQVAPGSSAKVPFMGFSFSISFIMFDVFRLSALRV